MAARGWRFLAATPAILLLAAAPAAADMRLLAPCDGDCAVAVYGGTYVENSMERILLTDPEPPWTWDYRDDHILALTLSRQVATLGRGFTVEAEVGLGKRFGRQSETEVWGAAYLRYRSFPWDRFLVTSVAVSTGLNYASDISDVERNRARDDTGDRLMHFFSPEITFALPEAPDREILFRLHHRSGVFGLVSDAWGGVQYGSIGIRYRF